MTEADLVRQLKRLRIGDGMTLARVARIKDDLLPLLGIEDPWQALQRIKAELNNMGESRTSRAVRSALTPDGGKSLDDRRFELAAAMGRDSVETVRKWEDAGFIDLALRLSAPSGVMIPTTEPEGGELFLTTTLEKISHYVDGSLVETTVDQRIVSLVDGLDRIPRRTRYAAVAQKMSVQSATGCKVDPKRSDIPEMWKFDVELSRKLSKHQAHRFRYRLIIEGLPARVERIMTISPTPTAGPQHVSFQAQFEGLHPDAAWTFEDVGYLDLPGAPGQFPELPIDALGGLGADFTNPRPGFVSGIGWRWPAG